MASKWSQAWMVDTGERVGTTGLYGVTTMITADATGVVSGDMQQWWLIVGLPMVLSLIKCLLVNLQGTEPTASAVGVTSTKGVHSA
jgi:hypothetical protein